jgi:hypothetical protein
MESDSTQAATRRWKGLDLPVTGRYELDTAHKRVGFVASHMMVSQVRGEFEAAAATIVVGEDPLESGVTAIIGSASLTTHNEERDTHLKSRSSGTSRSTTAGGSSASGCASRSPGRRSVRGDSVSAGGRATAGRR